MKESMMDRIQFIGQTHQGAIELLSDTIQYFDHTMAAYDVVECVDDLSVNRVPDNNCYLLKIKVTSPNGSDLDNMVNYVNNDLHNQIEKYDRTFNVNAIRNSDSVELSISEKVPNTSSIAL